LSGENGVREYYAWERPIAGGQNLEPPIFALNDVMVRQRREQWL